MFVTSLTSTSVMAAKYALLLNHSQVHYKQLSFIYEMLLVSHDPLWCHIFHIFLQQSLKCN